MCFSPQNTRFTQGTPFQQTEELFGFTSVNRCASSETCSSQRVTTVNQTQQRHRITEIRFAGPGQQQCHSSLRYDCKQNSPIFSSLTTFTNVPRMFTATLSNIMLQLKSIKQLVHISVQPSSIFLGTSTYTHIKLLLILIHKMQTHYPDTLQVASWAKINRVNLG